MIQWYKNLYVGDTAKKREKRIRERLEKSKLVNRVQLITLASNPENQLDIIPASILKQNAVFELLPVVVGIASDYEEALEIIARITAEVYLNTGTCKIRDYLENQK